MNSFYGLPHGLLVLLLAVPALSNASSSNTTGNSSTLVSPCDPFRALRLRVSSKPSQPICCLVPLSTEPLPTTSEFLSFEEWKSKQLELQALAPNLPPSPDAPTPDAPSGASIAASTTVLGDPEPPIPAPVELPNLSPHFRVPLTDRFNYASLDCSARVHTSHRAARSPAAILSSKKDRYMLSPCSADPNFVVVELCDDIRIDTVQLANFEFFSGVFREFRVSVAQTYTSDGQGWIEAGTYRAKNIRGVQSFHPLVELRPFYRYIRIDFLSHYGSEFYCPISLLRVYGLTQMEEWKWEVWQSGSESIVTRSLPDAESTAMVRNETIENGMSSNGAIMADAKSEPVTTNETTTSPNDTDRARDSSYTDVPTSVPETHDSRTATHDTLPTPTPSRSVSVVTHVTSTSNNTISSPPATFLSVVSDNPISTPTTSALVNRGDKPTDASLPLSRSSGSTNSTIASHNVSLPTVYQPGSSVHVLVPIPPPPPIPSGESIYRTIMNRLAMLETNTTLYQKYVEEQTLQVREALRRLEEDVGRLEGISKAQQHVFSKTMNKLNMRRHQMEEERWELLTKVNHLADEVTLEKRLGIAQLCLLLTVLVFLALTRGSRADGVSLLDDTMHRLNSFSRRRPRWPSTDWTRKRWTSRSPISTPSGFPMTNRGHKEIGRPVPISSATHKEKNPLSSAPFPTTPPGRSVTPRPHSHRPNTPRHDGARLLNFDRPSGRLRRSNSHTTPANAVLSAKRFARSAHLHEIPVFARTRDQANANEARAQDDGAAPGDGSPRPRGKGKVLSSMSARESLDWSTRGAAGNEADSESWVDTEPGSDSADTDEAGTDDSASQEVEVRSEFECGVEEGNGAPIINAPPFSRRRHHKDFIPPSPTLVMR